MKNVEDVGFQCLLQGSSTDGLGMVAGATAVAVGAIALLSRESRAKAELSKDLILREDRVFWRGFSHLENEIDSVEDREELRKSLSRAWESVLGPRRDLGKTSTILIYTFENALGVISQLPQKRQALLKMVKERPDLPPEALFVAAVQIGFGDPGAETERVNELSNILKNVKSSSERRRLSAAFLRSQIFLKKIPPYLGEKSNILEKHIWSMSEGPYAPSYYMASDNVGALIAIGNSPKKIFAPIDIDKRPDYLEGWDPDLAREDHIRQVCAEEVEKDIKQGSEVYETDDERWLSDTRAFSTPASNSPKITEWTVSACKDTPRRRALYQLRKLPSPYGPPKESRYIKEFGQNLYDSKRKIVEDADIESPRSSPESVFLRSLHRRVKEDQDKIFAQPEEKLVDLPSWWSSPELNELRRQGVEIRFLDTAQAIVREGLELNNCAQAPENYVPKVKEGESYLVGFRLPDGRRSTMEIEARPSIGTPSIIQHRTMNNELASGEFDVITKFVEAATRPY